MDGGKAADLGWPGSECAPGVTEGAARHHGEHQARHGANGQRVSGQAGLERQGHAAKLSQHPGRHRQHGETGGTEVKWAKTQAQEGGTHSRTAVELESTITVWRNFFFI
jgi:hypothetical protein